MLPSCLYFQIHPEFTMTLLIPSFWMVYRISLNNSRRRFFFSHKKGRLFKGRQLFDGGDYFKHCSLEVVFFFIFPWNQQMITSNKLNMHFFSAPDLVPWLPFIVNILSIRAWMVTDGFCHTRLHFTILPLDMEGI